MAKAVRSAAGILRRKERDRRKKKEVALRRRREAIAKLGGECVECGESDQTQLEFDHKDRFTKAFPVSRPPSEEKFWEEIAKCVLRCRKCHRRKSDIEMSGDNHHSAVLTSRDVLNIRKRLSEGATGRALAKEYGVGPMQISRIKNGKRWTCV